MDKDGHRAEFIVRLGMLKDKRFLDVRLAELDREDNKLNGLAQCSLISGHLFLRVWQIEPELKMSFLNPDGLKALLKKSPNALDHIDNEGDLILTASTKHLQA